VHLSYREVDTPAAAHFAEVENKSLNHRRHREFPVISVITEITGNAGSDQGKILVAARACRRVIVSSGRLFKKCNRNSRSYIHSIYRFLTTKRCLWAG